MARPNIFDVQVVYQTATDRAVCVKETETGPSIWLPEAQVEIDPLNPERGDVVTLTGPEWLLTEKGLL